MEWKVFEPLTEAPKGHLCQRTHSRAALPHQYLESIFSPAIATNSWGVRFIDAADHADIARRHH